MRYGWLVGCRLAFFNGGGIVVQVEVTALFIAEQ